MSSRVDCCPSNGSIPSIVSCGYSYALVSLPTVCPDGEPFTLNWDGKKWSGSGGLITKCEVTRSCTGSGSNAIHHLSYRFERGGCNFEGEVDYPVTTCGGVLAFAGRLEPAPALCCDSPGTPQVQFSLQVFVSLPIPTGEVPLCLPCDPNNIGPFIGGGGVSAAAADSGPIAADVSAFPVRYGTGELLYSATAIRSSGFGIPWGHSYNFRNRLSVRQTIGHGYNWQVAQWPYLVIGSDGHVCVQGGADGAFWFDRTSTGYVARYGVRMQLELLAASNRYRLSDQSGNVVEFDSVTGMFRKCTAPGGATLSVTALASNGYNIAAVQQTYTSGGNTITEEYVYEYATPYADSLLVRVTLRRKINSGAWTEIERASFTYYGPNEVFGGLQDLKSATTETKVGSSWVATGTSCYRYYPEYGDGSSSSSSGALEPWGPKAHMLKYVVEPAAYARLVADGYNPLTVSDAILSQYADYFFDYDSQRRVTLETTQSGSLTTGFEYSESGFSDGYNRWKTKTAETRPDGAVITVFANFVGQTMLKVLTSGDDQWLEFWKYGETGGSKGRVVLHANPSALTGYDEQSPDLLHEVNGNYEFLKDYEGKLELYGYHEANGLLASEKLRHGELGDCFKIREREYTSCCGSASGSSSSSSSSSGLSGACTWFPSRLIEYPDDGLPCGSSSSSSSASSSGGGCINDGTRQIITLWSYTFYSGTCAIQQRTTTLPVIPVEQNGSGVADSRKDYFDSRGNLTWQMDERGFLTRMTYDIPTGAVIQLINDVDTSQVTNAPPGWETPTGGGLHYITDYENDDQARRVQELGPEHLIDIDGVATLIRRATWMVYRDGLDQVWTAQGYQKVSDGSFVMANPVSITITDRQGKLLEQIQAVRLTGSGSSSSSSSSSGSSGSSGNAVDPTTVAVWTAGKLTANDSFPQYSYVALTTNQYTDCCLVVSQRPYKLIPAYGPGVEGTNYDELDFGYDALKRPIRKTTGGGTITRQVLDPRGLVLSTWIGTNDTGATPSDPTGGGATGNNMVQVAATQYDNGQDGGDGNPTTQTAYVDGSTTRVTVNLFDWRNRLIAIDGEIDFYEERCIDNLDRPYLVHRRNTTAGGNLIAKSTTRFDDRSRVYQSYRYGVNPATGAVGNALVDNTWYDSSSNVVKSLPAGSKAFTKTTIDSVGRTAVQYFGYNLSPESYADVFSVANDIILRQTEMAYDPASNLLQQTVRFRYHNASTTATGPLGSPSSTQPKARVEYVATYPDPLGRTQATANVGTNGGTALSRPDTIPLRSDDCLIHSTEFDAAGRVHATIDPADRKDCFFQDARSREIRRRLNCKTVPTSSSSSSSSSSSGGCEPSDDTNVDVCTAYNTDGNVFAVTAVNSRTGDQTTQYVHGTDLTNSDIASTLLLRKEILPDSEDEDDVKRYAYNRQGERTEFTDQNGTVHAYDYDLLGRQTDDRVTTAGTGIDTAVLRISRTYEVRSMVEYLTSYDDPTVGQGNVVNEVQFLYNDFAELTHDYQAHDGSVDVDTPVVQYVFEDGSQNTIRQTQLIYPSGRILHYAYGTTNSINEALSRVESLIDDDGDTHLVDYSYLGDNTFVISEYAEPQVRWTLIGIEGGNDPDTGDIYRGFDRFGRVKDNFWYNYYTNEVIDRLKYGYNRAGNRTYRENVVATAAGKTFDEAYAYDGLHRLKSMQRGLLNAEKITIDPASLTFAQCWQLDATGNWPGFQQNTSGLGVTLIQERSSNPVNEITVIESRLGAPWAQPGYDSAGQMTTIPNADNPSTDYAGIYDAWNRLTRLTDEEDPLFESAYDGTMRRIVQKTYSETILSETRHILYTEPKKWQPIEERVEMDPEAGWQFVFGSQYTDEVVLRDSSSERTYALQDANWNVTTIIHQAAAIAERFAYRSYGMPMFLTSNFESRDSSACGWQQLFAGYRWETNVSVLLVRHRILHAALGTWLQRDPLHFKAINLYEYVLSNPIAFVDPLGLDPPPRSIGLPAIVRGRRVWDGSHSKFIMSFDGPICGLPSGRYYITLDFHGFNTGYTNPAGFFTGTPGLTCVGLSKGSPLLLPGSDDVTADVFGGPDDLNKVLDFVMNNMTRFRPDDLLTGTLDEKVCKAGFAAFGPKPTICDILKESLTSFQEECFIGANEYATYRFSSQCLRTCLKRVGDSGQVSATIPVLV